MFPTSAMFDLWVFSIVGVSTGRLINEVSHATANTVDDADFQVFSPRVFLFITVLECEQEGSSGWGHCSTTSSALKNFSGSKPDELQRQWACPLQH